MSGAKHTAGPWQLADSDILNADEELTATAYCGGYTRNGGVDRARQTANATRIVKCVNAPEGIPDPAAFREVFGELVEALGLAHDLLTCDEIQSMAKKARLKGFVPDARKVSQALAKAKELQS